MPDPGPETGPENNPGTSQDTLLGGRVTIFQPAAGYRAAIDPVLLAAAVPAVAGDTVLDVGSGTGAAALSLAARLTGVCVTGLETASDLIRLAETGAEESGLAGRVLFIEGNLLSPPGGMVPGGFDHVMANPPYLAEGSGNPPPDAARRRATVEGDAKLGDWLRFALEMVRDGGTVTVIHRYDRLDEVTAGLKEGAGGLVVFPLWRHERGGEAKRVIVQARKGAAAEEQRTASGLVLHHEGGGYTPDAEAVLRGAGALML
ncbi:MAG: methyltransferase [Proteobacteria bacterium]|nr:methyltransferase [Pseudomonadota bacterium]